jgi:type II secretory pathway pseudopilin PulG
MAPNGLAGWARALAAIMAASALVVLLATTTYASNDDLSAVAGAARTLAQAGRSQAVGARSDSKGKDKDKDDDDKGKTKTKCGLGQYRPKKGACMPCPVGTYSDSLDEDECEECPKGSTTAAPGSSKKSDCNGELQATWLPLYTTQDRAKQTEVYDHIDVRICSTA